MFTPPPKSIILFPIKQSYGDASFNVFVDRYPTSHKKVQCPPNVYRISEYFEKSEFVISRFIVLTTTNTRKSFLITLYISNFGITITENMDLVQHI